MDKVSARMLKEAVLTLKSSLIVPVTNCKFGDSSNPGNYRPITYCGCVCTVLFLTLGTHSNSAVYVSLVFGHKINMYKKKLTISRSFLLPIDQVTIMIYSLPPIPGTTFPESSRLLEFLTAWLNYCPPANYD